VSLYIAVIFITYIYAYRGKGAVIEIKPKNLEKQFLPIILAAHNKITHSPFNL